jgi:hypothetical protein
MPRLPLVVRVAAGLAATAVDEVRSLPSTVVSLPVTAVSQVLQSYMRTQQQVTALAIRGDELLSFLTPGQEQPEWATFDEDDHPPVATPPAGRPSSAGRFALYSQVPEDVETSATANRRTATKGVGPAGRATPNTARRKAEKAAEVPRAPLPGYDAMTLAQLRARLRTLSLTELEDLLLHERAAQARAPFLTMLSNRIATVRSQ